MKNIIVLAVAALAFAGCSSSPRHIEPCADFSPAQIINDHRVVTDSTFDSACYIVRMGQEVIPGMRWQYKLLLANKTSVPQQAHYMVLWYDGEGNIIDKPTPGWLSTTVLTGEYKEVRIPAPSAAARDFRLYLQGRYDAEARERCEEAKEE